MRLRLIILLVLAAIALPSSSGRAEDRVTVRGNYYREPSTRVLQPLVDVSVDVPDERFTVGATYLLDAITSASIAAGTLQVTGGDQLFTELRHEASGRVGGQLGPWSLGGGFRYSTETDYIARSLAASVGRDFLHRALTLRASYSFDFNRVYRITNSLGERMPWCGGVQVMECSGEGFGPHTNALHTHYAALAYSHALLPTLHAHAALELAFLRGPQDNPYRAGVIPNAFPEAHPLQRDRVAVSGSVRWMIPRAHMVLEPTYRYYTDDWKVQAHSPDLRVHFRLWRHLLLRVRYRYYQQNQAYFWRDDMVYSGEDDELRSGDPKMDDFQSHTPGIQVAYEFDDLARFRGFAWLEGAWIEATYNHVIYRYDAGGSLYCGDGRRVCGARLGSLAFSLAF